MGCVNTKEEIKLMKLILRQLEVFSTEMINCRNEIIDLNKKLDKHINETLPYRCISS